ncbi:MAG: hypothetical protein ACLP1W_08145 [Rhodomicrobium sp.]
MSGIMKKHYEYVAEAARLREREANNASVLTKTSKLESLPESAHFPMLRLPHRPLTSFIALQEWECCVSRINDDSFIADLVDITGGSALATEQTEFLKSDLSFRQQAELRIGAVFRWSIGYEKSPSGKRRTSQLVFRKLPQWSQADIDEARAFGRDLSQKLSGKRLDESSKPRSA